MPRPYTRPNISLHPYNEGGTPPAIVIRSVPLSGLDTVSHQVDFVVGGETVASVSLYSHINAPILVTQIDERNGADDIVEQFVGGTSMRYGQHWNMTQRIEPDDPPPPVWIVQERYPGPCREGHWYTADDDDHTPAVFNDERDAEQFVAKREAERTDDGEPTNYQYRIVEGYVTEDGGWNYA